MIGRVRSHLALTCAMLVCAATAVRAQDPAPAVDRWTTAVDGVPTSNSRVRGMMFGAVRMKVPMLEHAKAIEAAQRQRKELAQPQSPADVCALEQAALAQRRRAYLAQQHDAVEAFERLVGEGGGPAVLLPPTFYFPS